MRRGPAKFAGPLFVLDMFDGFDAGGGENR
jgi:hypothetical protein